MRTIEFNNAALSEGKVLGQMTENWVGKLTVSHADFDSLNCPYFNINTSERAGAVPKGDQQLQSSLVHRSVLPPCEFVMHTGTVFLLMLVLTQVITK